MREPSELGSHRANFPFGSERPVGLPHHNTQQPNAEQLRLTSSLTNYEHLYINADEHKIFTQFYIHRLREVWA
jgi:hypothetical protein